MTLISTNQLKLWKDTQPTLLINRGNIIKNHQSARKKRVYSLINIINANLCLADRVLDWIPWTLNGFMVVVMIASGTDIKLKKALTGALIADCPLLQIHDCIKVKACKLNNLFD